MSNENKELRDAYSSSMARIDRTKAEFRDYFKQNIDKPFFQFIQQTVISESIPEDAKMRDAIMPMILRLAKLGFAEVMQDITNEVLQEQ